MNIQSLINKLFRRDPKMKPNLCYSQNGEDLILNRLFENKEKGFFIDVGAHHPIRFSNTYLFYKKGWSEMFCPKLITLEKCKFHGPFANQYQMKAFDKKYL